MYGLVKGKLANELSTQHADQTTEYISHIRRIHDHAFMSKVEVPARLSQPTK
jgi:hypothetical protein